MSPLMLDEVGPEFAKFTLFSNETTVHNYNVLMLYYAVLKLGLNL